MFIKDKSEVNEDIEEVNHSVLQELTNLFLIRRLTGNTNFVNIMLHLLLLSPSLHCQVFMSALHHGKHWLKLSGSAEQTVEQV